MATHTISFDEERFGGWPSLPPGSTTLTDELTSTTFSVEPGEMYLQDANDNTAKKNLFFTPQESGKPTDEYGRFTIRFAAYQKKICFNFWSDFTGAVDHAGNIIPISVHFYEEAGNPFIGNLVASRTHGSFSSVLIEWNQSNRRSVREVVITTKGAENWIDNLEFEEGLPRRIRRVSRVFAVAATLLLLTTIIRAVRR